MGLFDALRGDKQQILRARKPPAATAEIKPLSDTDRNIMREAFEKGIPCIPFIPTSALQQLLSAVKPDHGLGYPASMEYIDGALCYGMLVNNKELVGKLMIRIPALYEDGTVRYLYKEPLSLLGVINPLLSHMNASGRTYFFIGIDIPMEAFRGTSNDYLSPLIFCQQNFSLYNVEFQEELEFFHSEYAPSLELTFIPEDHNPKVGQVHVINFTLAARLHPIGEKEDPSNIFQNYEQWKTAQYPTEGAQLKELFDFHVGQWRDTVNAQQEPDKLVKQSQEPLRVNLNDANTHSNLGSAYYFQGKLNEAVREYRKALRNDPNNAQAHYDLACCYSGQGKTDEEVSEYKECLRINPKHWGAHHNLGVVYKNRGNLNEAIREFREALRINPNLAESHHSLGNIYCDQGKVNDGIKEFREALRINPNLAESHHSLGTVYFNQKKYHEAVREYHEALRIKPNLAEAQNVLEYLQKAQENEQDA